MKTGLGIAAADLDHIFEPFHFREVMGSSSGNGLGLAVVWKTMREEGDDLQHPLGYAIYGDSGRLRLGAVEMLRRNPVEPVILDMLMAPGWNGRRTWEEILRINPRQKAILVSGYSENGDVRACFALGVGALLKRTCTLEQRCGEVRDELSR
jgi:DNA-binding NarL/FixJ family response regulator